MVQNYLVTAAAWLEIVAGAIFVIFPNIACRLLFLATLDGLAWPLAHWVGIALLALGIACLPSKTTELHDRTVLALFVYNICVAVLLLRLGATGIMRGPLLWPAAILHSIISVALLLLLFQRGYKPAQPSDRK
jgi:hypothetical protein